MTNTLDECFFHNCEIGYSKYYKEYFNEIIFIPNFFSKFNKAKTFLRSLNVWNSNSLSYLEDITADLSNTSTLPNWITHYLLKKYFIENFISNNISNYTTFIKYSYNGISKEKVKKFPNFRYVGQGIVPHIDLLPGENPPNIEEYICLVNISNFPISTCFWEFEGDIKITTEKQNIKYQNFIFSCNEKYDNLDKKDIVLPKNLFVKYKKTFNPNECIIYQPNLLHSPFLDDNSDENNQRSILKMTFLSQKI